MEQTKRRIELIDALRGVSVCLMIVHHIVYDSCVFCGAPWSWFENPVVDGIHYLSAGAFVLLSGVSSNFSRSNVKRGLRALALAMVITVVTSCMDMPIIFGVLHLLGTCMLLYGLTQAFWRKLPAWVIPALSVAGIFATAGLTNGRLTTIPHLWIFGLVTPDFVSTDYFPLLPWIFLFLLGTWVGGYVRDGRLPVWVYEAKAPRFAAIGRRSLVIYMLHQPVLYALAMLVKLVFLKR